MKDTLNAFLLAALALCALLALVNGHTVLAFTTVLATATVMLCLAVQQVYAKPIRKRSRK